MSTKNIQNTKKTADASAPNTATAPNLRRNLLWNSLGNFVYMVAQYALTFLATRILGFEAAGIFSLAISVGNIVYAVSGFTMRYFQASDVRLQFSPATYITSRILTSLVAFVGTLVFLGFNNYDALYVACIIVYVIYKCTEAISDVYQAILQIADRMDFIGKAYLFKAISQTVVFALVIALTQSLLAGLVVITLMGIATLAIYEIPITKAHFSFSWSKADAAGAAAAAATPAAATAQPANPAPFSFARLWQHIPDAGQLLKACSLTAIYGLAFGSVAQISRFALAQVLGTQALGFYTSAAMPVVVVQVLCNYIFSPLVTPLAHAFNQRNFKLFTGYIAKVTVAIVAVALLAFGANALLGCPVMVFLYTSRIEPYLYLLNPLILMGALVAVAQFLATVLIICRETRTLAIITVVCYVPTMLTVYPLLDVAGMNGPTLNYILYLVIFIAATLATLTVLLRRGKSAT